MSDIIQNLINEVLDDGARSSKFGCLITLPEAITGQNSQHLDILCKVASIPSKSTEVINLKYKGKDIPIPGQEKFEQSLEITFYLEENHHTRILFDRWLDGMHYENYASEVSKESKKIQTGTGFVSQFTLHQLNFEGEAPTANYTFYNVFPKELASISVDSSSVDTILEYNVSFSYSHYTVASIDSPLNANEFADKLLGDIQNRVNKIVKGGIGAMQESSAPSIRSLTGSINSSIKSVGTKLSEFLG